MGRSLVRKWGRDIFPAFLDSPDKFVVDGFAGLLRVEWNKVDDSSFDGPCVAAMHLVNHCASACYSIVEKKKLLMDKFFQKLFH